LKIGKGRADSRVAMSEGLEPSRDASEGKARPDRARFTVWLLRSICAIKLDLACQALCRPTGNWPPMRLLSVGHTLDVDASERWEPPARLDLKRAMGRRKRGSG